MPKIDDSNSLEYRRIADTYQCVYFVNKSDNNYYIHNGSGFRTPFYTNGNVLYVDSNKVYCNGDIITKTLNPINRLNTNTLSCYRYNSSTTNVHISNFSYTDVIENEIYGGKHVVTCSNAHAYLDEMRKQTLNDLNKFQTKVAFLSSNGIHSTNTLTYKFKIPEDVDLKKCYFVIFTSFVVWLHNTAVHELYINMNGVKTQLSNVTHNFTTNEGADRAMQGGSFGSFVYTLAPGTITTRDFDISIETTADIDYYNNFDDIVLMYGE